MGKHEKAGRFGGPGASNENARTGISGKRAKPDAGQKKHGMTRNPHHSAISGGGGELDSHHTHDPELKG